MMAVILSVRKIGNCLYMSLPKNICKKEHISHGDFFELESDVITKNTYNLRKIGSDNGKL